MRGYLEMWDSVSMATGGSRGASKANKAKTYLNSNFKQKIISKEDDDFCIDIDDETDRTYL